MCICMYIHINNMYIYIYVHVYSLAKYLNVVCAYYMVVYYSIYYDAVL